MEGCDYIFIFTGKIYNLKIKSFRFKQVKLTSHTLKNLNPNSLIDFGEETSERGLMNHRNVIFELSALLKMYNY